MGRDGNIIFDYITVLVISIHAPRVGRDLDGDATMLLMNGISIHAPRVGRDCSIQLSDTM